MHRIMGYKEIARGPIMVSYPENLDYEIIKQHDGDFGKLSIENPDIYTNNLTVASVDISAAIIAYSRIYIARLKLDVMNNLGGKLYYSDTDSIVTDVKLPDNMVHSTELGKLKLEHKVRNGIFISGKLYVLYTEDKVKLRSKGVNQNSFDYNSFLLLLTNNDVVGIKTQSKKDWFIGHVKIFDKEITIHSDNYTKRLKITDLKGYLLDTKPKVINNLNKKLILYNPNMFSLTRYKDNTKFIKEIRYIIDIHP
uniref:putative DNA polymerase-like protein n=1 Tax=Periconia digitata TaxID=1303443 RepID=UPI0023AB3318|nr:putative DNA polymerase-like protein [Periconia digitata]WCA44870.1 putative DNA polymerase-like protein [Periconia digitata]